MPFWETQRSSKRQGRVPYHLSEPPFTLSISLACTIPLGVPAALGQVLESFGHILCRGRRFTSWMRGWLVEIASSAKMIQQRQVEPTAPPRKTNIQLLRFTP
jgi:hypothetical protein